MEQVTVIKMRKRILIFLLMVCTNLTSQTRDKDYYALSKEGEKYLKPVKYILLKNNKNKKIYSNQIVFFVEGQRFSHDINIDEVDTCSISILDNIKVSSIKQLFSDEYEEHKSKLEHENHYFPPPPNHYNLKLLLIERISPKQIIKYEVDWIYTIP